MVHRHERLHVLVISRRSHFHEWVCTYIIIRNLHPHLGNHNALRRNFTIIQTLLSKHRNIIVDKNLLTLGARKRTVVKLVRFVHQTVVWLGDHPCEAATPELNPHRLGVRLKLLGSVCQRK